MRRLCRGLGRLIRATLLVWVATLGAVVLWTYLWPMDGAAPPRGDVIVCLGAGQRADGTPGPASNARAASCAALYHAGAAPRVIFTGAGRGAISTARGMADLSGLPPEVTVIEPEARSTLQNALFSRALIDEGARVILVTEAYHLPRSWASFRAMGVDDLTLSPAARLASPDRLRALLRESVAIWFNAARYLLWRVAHLAPVSETTRVDLLR